MTFTESTIEQAAIDWLKDLGYAYAYGPEIAFNGEHPERSDFQEPLLLGRLQKAIARLNRQLPTQAQEEALRKITRLGKPSLLLNNHAFHHLLVNGIEVEYKAIDGRAISGRAYVVDFENLEENEFLVVNQYTVEASHQNGKVNRRPDLVVFVNGLPLAVIELKNAADEKATVWTAFNQLQTYKQDIPALFHYNELLIVSDGLSARMGSLTANKEWFLPWKTVEGQDTAPASLAQLEVLIRGVFEKRRLLDLLRYFIVFEQERGAPTVKKIAGYHQFHAVNYALAETIRAAHAVIGKGPRAAQIEELILYRTLANDSLN